MLSEAQVGAGACSWLCWSTVLGPEEPTHTSCLVPGFLKTENKLSRLRNKALCNLETPPLGKAMPLDGNGLFLLLTESICLHTCLMCSLPGAQEGHPGMPDLWLEPCSTRTPEGRLCLEPGLLGSSCHGAARVNAKG